MQDAMRGFLLEGEQAGIPYALQTPRQSLVGLSGSVLNQRSGSSLEFRDHREYQAGDDLRHIDWNAYARTDQYTVKVYHEEVTPHLDLLIDTSCSMALEDSQKARATLALAGFFATAARNVGFSHTAWQLGGEVRRIGNSSGFPHVWDGLDFSDRGPPGSIARAAASWKPRGVRILLSDLLWEGDPLVILRPLAERAGLTLVLQILANADANPLEGQALRLVDSETGQIHEIHVDAFVLQRYRAGLIRHQENWNTACRQVGAQFATVIAEGHLRTWNMDDLVARGILKVV